MLYLFAFVALIVVTIVCILTIDYGPSFVYNGLIRTIVRVHLFVRTHVLSRKLLSRRDLLPANPARIES